MSDIGETVENKETGEKLIATSSGWKPYTRAIVNDQTGAELFDIDGRWQAADAVQGITQAAAQQAPQRQTRGEAISSGIIAAADAALFGLSDEFIGAPVSAVIQWMKGDAPNVKEGWKRYMEYSRGQQRQFKEEKPITALAASLPGYVLGGAGLVKGAEKATRRKVSEYIVKHKIVGGAALGAVEGAGFGFGEAEGNLMQRLDDAAWGATKGLFFGAGTGLAFKAATKVALNIKGAYTAVGRLKKGLPMRDIDARAMDALSRKLEDLGLGAEEALKRTEKAIDIGAPGALALEALGPQGVSLARGAVGRGTEPAVKGVEFLQKRAEKTFKHVEEITEGAFSGGKKRNFKVAVDDVIKTRKVAAKKAFDEANKVVINPVAYQRQLAPFIADNKKAVRNAMEIAQAEGDKVSLQQLQLAFRQDATVLDSKALGLFLSGLADVEAAAFKRGNMNLYRAIQVGKENFIENLGSINPKMIAAREQYAGFSRMEDAAKYGRKIFFKNVDPEDIAAAFKGYTAGEKELFLTGVMRAIREKASDATTTGDAVSRFFRSSGQREKLQAVFPDDDSYQRFADRMDELIEQSQINVALDPMKGAKTAAMEAGERAISGKDIGNLGLDGITIGWLRGSGKFAIRIMKKLAPDDTETQAKIAQFLFETPAQLRSRIIKLMERQMSDQGVIDFPLLAQSVPAVTAGTIGALKDF